ncbi:unnamed protein product [Ostreobium quekettii]|uniref:ORMDL family protein n=1 Tax=Ostreobium quekettii TaxID=121088 RepID=A0A8S1JF63_9CHLO|nr:unnamed protein product [Ostreobium quekettii]|eukprot:evm.model.scf_23.12 EVM.evm.TU.scf_23.12   scf_23:104148-104606(+)
MPHSRTVSEVRVNKNTNWLNAQGAWLWYLGLIALSWLAFSAIMGPGLAWTYVHLLHGVVTFYLMHWIKGSPIEEDQGMWDGHTFWEQLDDGEQGTRTRKFLAVVPLVLFLLATHGSDFRQQPLLLNLVLVVALLVAKTPGMHGVRLFGINKY